MTPGMFLTLRRQAFEVCLVSTARSIVFFVVIYRSTLFKVEYVVPVISQLLWSVSIALPVNDQYRYD